MSELLTQAEAEVLLENHSPALTKVIADGWKRWRQLVKDDAALGAILSNRSRASIVYDCIRHEALRTFDDTESVVVSEDRGFLLLTFEERIILRFKKFRDEKLHTSGTSTRQAYEYAHQTLPGMESLTHLVAGYLPDEVGIELKTAAITCPLGNGLEWIIELDLTQVVGDTVEQRDLATVTRVGTSETAAGTIVRPRRSDQDAQGADQQASSER